MSITATHAPEAQAGELSPLKRAYLALERLQARCEALEAARSGPIAVVGLACRLPGGADTPEAYWRLLRSGTDAIREVPPGRWDMEAYHDPDPAAPGRMCTRLGGYLSEPVDGFDPQFFGISPREAETMDPQQRLLLEVAWEALENAAQVESRLAGSSTGVFIGITSHDYADWHLAGQDPRLLGTHAITGNTHNAAAGRLSYCFGFQGPCLAVDTACSSSLVAVHLACQSLRAGECRRALAGGVNLILSPLAGIALSQGRVLAADGRCRAFDAAASGMARGEGCGVVVLKRLEDAQADGDTVLAVIRGSAVNQDGPSSGLTVPNGPAQEALIRQALRQGGLAPEEIDYIEAHGTGTPLGDPIELNALAGVFGAGRDRPLLIGSVKTNLGHLEAAAGIAGLIKTVLALREGEIPAHLHLREPTPHLDWAALPFRLPTEARPWPAGARPRRAGVSSFGFSGVNAHVVIEEAPAPPPRAAEPADRPLHLLALSGRSEPLLREAARRLAGHLERHPDLPLPDICFAAGAGRAHASHRLGLVAASTAEARAGLAGFLEERPAAGLEQGSAGGEPRIAFLFTGQGAQRPGMGRALYATEPGFRRTLQRCDEILRPELPRPLLDILYGDPADGALLESTACAQPALFALGYALAELWGSWGVRPALLLGHSLGEYAAACVAGVFGLEDGLRLVAARGRLMAALPREGGMLAVLAPAAVVERLIGRDHPDLAIAAHNAPDSIVVSGRHAALAALAARLEAAGIGHRPLRVSHAFHSPLMDPALAAFERRMGEVALAMPRVALVSNLSGAIAGAEVTQPGYWRRHLREPVRFAEGVRAAREAGCTLFLELGPDPVLLGLARQSLPEAGLAWLPSLRRGAEDWRQMLESLAGLYCRGAPVDWAGFDRGRDRRRLSLPTTPFQRQRCWLDRPAGDAAGPAATPGAHPLLGERLDLAGTSEICFQSWISSDSPLWLQDHQVFGEPVLPAAATLEMAAAAALAAFGWEEIAVEDAVFRQAVRLPGGRRLRLQTLLRPGQGGGCGFEIHARAEGEAGWTCHVAGTLAPPRGAAAAPPSLAALRADPGEAVEVAALYARAVACGVTLGPRLQALRRAWRRGTTALGEIALPEAQGSGGAWLLHPVLLDAALQAMGAVFLGRAGAETCLPAALDRFRLHRQAGPPAWSLVRIERVGAQALRADVQLLTAAGEPVAELEGLHLRPASREQVAGAGPAPAFADWLYALEWRPEPGGPDLPPAEFLPEDAAISGTLLPGLAADLAEPPELRGYGAFLEEIERLGAAHVTATLARMGWPLRPGQRFATAELADRLGVVARHRRLFGRLLGILAEAGLLEPDGEATWRVRDGLEAPAEAAEGEALLRRYPPAAAEIALLERCAGQLGPVLRGECDPLPLLFPGDGSVTAAHLYRDSPGARATNLLMRELLAGLLERLPADRAVRILEIGGGTGGTTASLLPVLPAGRAEYAFTDISPHFVREAGERFRDHPGLRCGVLDIEQPPAAQGFAGGFDLAIAANVLHATRDLRQSLGHVRELLAPGGLLLLLEGTAPLRFIDLTFGLLEGWWRFADTALRPSHPLLPAEAWQGLLRDCGFHPAGTLAAPRGEGRLWSTQALLVARAQASARHGAEGRPRRWILLAQEGARLAGSLAGLLEARGDRVTLVHSGEAHGRIAAGVIRANPRSPADLRAILAEAMREGEAAPAGILHLWATGPEAGDEPDPEREGVAGWESALHLVQAAAGAGPGAPPLWLVTQGAQPVRSGEGLPGLLHAPVWGLGRVARLEHPELRCVCLDLESGDDDAAARALLAELDRAPTEGQVAWRGGRRHVARFVRHRGEARGGEARRRDAGIGPEGTYLVTGGHRGLGLATARFLAERGARSLVLAGRGDADEALRREVAALRGAGVAVEVARTDIGDRAQVEVLLGGIAGRLPPLRGIVHAAGLLDDGILAQQDAGRFRRVLAPKLLGAWHLHLLTRGQPLDLFVLYSSLASMIGSAGQANHAAANAFLDALAHHRRSLGLPALSINWGVWSGIGAAARGDVGARARTGGMGSIEPAQGLAVLEHLLATEAVQVGVAPIDWSVFARRAASAQDLAFFSDFAEWRQAGAPPGATPPEPPPGTPMARPGGILAGLRAQVAAVLRLAPEAVDTERPLNRLGLDSLMAVELRNRVRQHLGLEVPLVAFMEDASIAALASRLAALRAGEGEARGGDPALRHDAAGTGRLQATPLLRRLDELADAEVDALLAEALAEDPDLLAAAEEERP